MSLNPLSQESIWFDKWRFEDAEASFYKTLAVSGLCAAMGENTEYVVSSSSLVSEIVKAREQIQKSLHSKVSTVAADHGSDFLGRVQKLEEENYTLKKVTEDLQVFVKKLETRIAGLEQLSSREQTKEGQDESHIDKDEVEIDKDDDDFELFGSDEEDNEEAERIKEERLKAYAEKKSKKPALIAKSNVILDVKPWDDETDMKELEKHVRSIEMDGLLWGASKLVPVGYGIKKLQISTVIEDDKVSVDELEERITSFEDFVQSVDVAAFNKI